MVGNNLETVQHAIAMALSISPSEQLCQQAGEILRGGISGSNCKNIAVSEDKKVECAKSGNKIFYYLTEIVPPIEVTNLTKEIQSSIANWNARL